MKKQRSVLSYNDWVLYQKSWEYKPIAYMRMCIYRYMYIYIYENKIDTINIQYIYMYMYAWRVVSTSWIWSVLSMNSQQNGQRTRYSAQIYRKRKTKHVRKSCRIKDAPTKTHLVWSRLCDHWRRTITLSWELWKHENKTHTDTLHIHVYLSLLFLAHLLCLFVQMCVFLAQKATLPDHWHIPWLCSSYE